MIGKHGRQYDLILLGATGYTGQLTAEHITTHLPTNLTWALAGRTESKLRGVIEDCKKLHSDRELPGVEVADVKDTQQVTSLVKKAFAIITTVGPYCKYGELVFRACAENGTHYMDCTGEFPWVHSMIKKYEQTAKGSGAIMLPQIGIESAPPDICTWLLARHLREKLGAKTGETTVTIHKLHSAPSGGTLATVFDIFDYFSLRDILAASKPYAQSPSHHQEPTRPPRSILQRLLGIRSIPDLGLVTTSIAGGTDIPVIERSWGLLSQIPSRKGEAYGPNFRWQEFYKVRNWLEGVAVHWGLLLGSFFLAAFPPVRAIVRSFVYQPGEGTTRERMASEEVEYRGIAFPDTLNKSDKRAFCRARFNGSMYYLTGLILAQAALTLIEDDVGLDGGIYTAACLGERFVSRAHDVGFKTEVKLLQD